MPFQGFELLTHQQTLSIAEHLVGSNANAATQLKDTGSADLSYALEGVARFRVNVFKQRSTCAIVMRLIPVKIPSFQDLGLPEILANIVSLRNGIVLVTGPTGSGKSSTLAAIVDRMNEERAIHILTIEDPRVSHPRPRGRRRFISASCTATRRTIGLMLRALSGKRRRSSWSAK